MDFNYTPRDKLTIRNSDGLVVFPTQVDTTKTCEHYEGWPVCNVGIVQRDLVLLEIGEGQHYSTIPALAELVMRGSKHFFPGTIDDLTALHDQYPDLFQPRCCGIIATGTVTMDNGWIYVPVYGYNGERCMGMMSASIAGCSALYLARLHKDT